MAAGSDARSLLYVAVGSLSVEVFTYPAPKPIGSLGVGGYPLCSDRFGNVFVAGAEGISYVWRFSAWKRQAYSDIVQPAKSWRTVPVDESSENVAVADSGSSSMVIFPYYRKQHRWRLARQ